MRRALGLVRRRLIGVVPVFCLVVLGAFLLLEAAPGDAVDAYLAGIGGGDAAGIAARMRALGFEASLNGDRVVTDEDYQVDPGQALARPSVSAQQFAKHAVAPGRLDAAVVHAVSMAVLTLGDGDLGPARAHRPACL